MPDYPDMLKRRIQRTGSSLCVGIDPRPEAIIESSVETWVRSIIEQTSDVAAAFKPNSAYFEALGSSGFAMMEKLRSWIPSDIPLLLDAKRSDIGETQKYYAKAAFDVIGADAITLNPFLGEDTLEPFLAHPGKGLYLLAVTSNPGSADLQRRSLGDQTVYQRVCEMCRDARTGLVIGLTNADGDILPQIPDVPLLIPGLGAQGGDLERFAQSQRQAPILFNVSRGILFPPAGKTPAQQAQFYSHEIARITRSHS